jgi:hypothetical protein
MQVIKSVGSICIEQSCGKLYVAILMMISLTQFMVGCFIVEFLRFGANDAPFLCCAEM